MPKCEIFEVLGFRDFCTTKPFWVGDLGSDKNYCILFLEEISNKLIINLLGICSTYASAPYAYSQHMRKFLTLMLAEAPDMLSIRISSLCIYSAYA